jgi:hypothetical protein
MTLNSVYTKIRTPSVPAMPFWKLAHPQVSRSTRLRGSCHAESNSLAYHLVHFPEERIAMA